MRKALLTLEQGEFEIVEIGGAFFKSLVETRTEIVKKPLLDSNGEQIMNDLNENEKAPAFYFEQEYVQIPRLIEVKLSPEEIELFEKAAISTE